MFKLAVWQGLMGPILLIYYMVLGVGSVAEAAEFRSLNWFQILFCQDVRHLGFDQPATASEVPAFGFSGDQFDRSGRLHFWRWDLLSGSEFLHVTIPPSVGITSVKLGTTTLASDGRRALVASTNLDVILFDTVDGRVLQRFSGHRFETTVASFAQTSDKIAAADVRGNVWIWNSATADRPENVVNVPSFGILHIRFIDNDSMLEVWTINARKVFDLATGSQLTHIDVVPALANSNFAVSDDQRFLVGTGSEKVSYLYNLETGALVWSKAHARDAHIPEGFPDYVWGHAISPNGRCVIASTGDKLIAMDAISGEVLVDQSVGAGSFYWRFTPDSRYLVAGGGCNINTYATPDVCL